MSASDPSTPAPTEYASPARQVRIMAATLCGTASGVLPAFLVGSQAVQLRRDLGFDLAGIGAAVAVAWIAASIASTPMGRVAERFGGGRSLRLAALVNAAMMAAVALFAQSLGGLMVFIAVAGLGNALAQPGANLLTARTIPPARQGFAFAVKQSAVPVATLLGGLAVTFITLPYGWRWTFAAGAVFAVVSAAAVAVERRPDPAVIAREIEVDAEFVDAPLVTVARAGRIDRARLRPLLVLAMGVGLGAAAAGALSSFLVSGGVLAGIAEGSAGLLLALGSVVGISVRLFMGWRADRRGGDQLIVVAAMMVVGSLALALLGTEVPLVYLLATPVAFGAGWAWPGLFNLSVVQEYPHAPGAATGITQTGTYLGAGLGPLAFGAIVDSHSFTVAWPLSALGLVSGAAFMLLGRRALGRSPVRQTMREA